MESKIYLIYSNLYSDYREIVGYLPAKEIAEEYCLKYKQKDLTIVEVKRIDNI